MAYKINGENVELPDPLNIGGVIFVPAGKVTELLGGYVSWDNATKTAELELGSKKAKVTVDSDDVYVGDEVYTLPSPPAMGGGSIWVPLVLFSEVLGATASDDGVGNISISV